MEETTRPKIHIEDLSAAPGDQSLPKGDMAGVKGGAMMAYLKLKGQKLLEDGSLEIE